MAKRARARRVVKKVKPAKRQDHDHPVKLDIEQVIGYLGDCKKAAALGVKQLCDIQMVKLKVSPDASLAKENSLSVDTFHIGAIKRWIESVKGGRIQLRQLRTIHATACKRAGVKCESHQPEAEPLH
jgi:hypothetical protein